MSLTLSLLGLALSAAGTSVPESEADTDEEAESETAPVEVSDPACHFSLALDVDADVCVVHPPSLRDAKACEAMGVDVSKIPVAPATIASAMLHYDEGTTFLQIFKTDWHQSWSGREMRQLIDASVEATRKRVGAEPKAHGLEEGAPFDTLPLDEGKALRYVLELPKKPDNQVNRFLHYAFPSGDCLIQLSFATEEAQLENVADIADGLVMEAEVSHPRSDAEQLGYRIGYVVGFACCLGSFVAAGVLAFFFLYRAAKKNPPPAPGPPKAVPVAQPVGTVPPAGAPPSGSAPPSEGEPPKPG